MNPVAIPDPSQQAEDNFSWMCLITPYYESLTENFNAGLMENNVLKQHYEYFIRMEQEKEEFDDELKQLKGLESQLVN